MFTKLNDRRIPIYMWHAADLRMTEATRLKDSVLLLLRLLGDGHA